MEGLHGTQTGRWICQDVGETSWGKWLVDLGIYRNPYKTGPVQGDGIDFQGVFLI